MRQLIDKQRSYFCLIVTFFTVNCNEAGLSLTWPSALLVVG
jgi:hypothetical protein